MIPFATEFAVKPFERAEFIALVIGWLQGTDYCELFGKDADADLSAEQAYIRAPSGEEITFQELKEKSSTQAIGFRYQRPDEQGRLWRTEFVVTQGDLVEDEPILRTRTQCLAHKANAKLESPKKPFILKSLIEEKRALDDGYFVVSDEVHCIDESDYSLDIVKEGMLGAGSYHLPIVYISRLDDGSFWMSEKQIRKLAFELGGVAHIVAEPSRAFSQRLRAHTNGENAYGGSVGVYLPGTKLGRKFYIGGSIRDSFDLFRWISDYCTSIRSRLPSKGWDWTELQEQALRKQRERDKERLSFQETEQLYEQEIEALKERIHELETSSLLGADSVTNNDEYSKKWDQSAFLIDLTEFYSGEASDRLQYLLRCVLDQAEAIGLDDRSIVVAKELLKLNSPSQGLRDLKAELTKVTKDPKKYSKEVVKLLQNYGFELKSDKKHIRMEPKESLIGLGSMTIAKTPSDHRTLKNQKAHIEGCLGITKL